MSEKLYEKQKELEAEGFLTKMCGHTLHVQLPLPKEFALLEDCDGEVICTDNEMGGHGDYQCDTCNQNDDDVPEFYAMTGERVPHQRTVRCWRK